MSPKSQKIISVFLICASSLAIFCLALLAASRGKTAFGIEIGDEKLGGLPESEARLKVEKIIEKAQAEPFRLVFEEKEWKALPTQLGVEFNAESTKKDIVSFAREGGLANDLVKQGFAFFFGKKFSLAYRLDKEKLLDFLDNEFSGDEDPAQNARLQYDRQTGNFSFIGPSEGEIFDRDQIVKQLEKRLESFSYEPITLKKTHEYPTVMADSTGSGQNQAKAILANAPYELKIKGGVLLIPKEIAAEWLEYLPGLGGAQTMQAGISHKAVKEYLISALPAVNKAPINASLALDRNGKVFAFSLGQKGIQLNMEESAANIRQGILAGNKQIDLAFEEIEPEISALTINNLGLTHLLGTGISDFAGSPNNRMHNIRIGTAKIAGFLLKSGEEFSFIQKIGEIDEASGYLPELVIKKGKTTPEYGGGICQVSTTLFRAAINAGLKILERQPHAFPVKYYNPQGFDATIYPPHPDLRFINDTPNNILLQPKIEGTKITFEIYGTRDNRGVKITGPTILEANEDGSMKTILIQEILRNGASERKDTFRSNYKSPALYPVEKNPLE